jgi:Escherichia/Staphylococcus phage prohead protease
MTELELEQTVHDRDIERGLIRRTFAAELTAGDGRTVDCRIVPYGERIIHNDGLGGLPVGQPYTEEWVAGAFSHQLRAANRVLANFEHQQGIAGVVGHGLELRDSPDSLRGSFRIHETADGDKALMLVREGVLGGISLEAIPKKSIRTAAGIVQRVKAHLRAVALCREPAYSGAVVLAVRELPILDEELLPADMDAETVERCRRLGIKLPQRYQAHPDETDTPAQTGTSENGTRQTTEATTSEETWAQHRANSGSPV